MDITTRKYRFIERFINTVNSEDCMKLFESLLDSQSEESDIVAYTVKGEPLTKEQYLQQIQESEKDIAEGKFKTTSELEEEVKNW